VTHSTLGRAVQALLLGVLLAACGSSDRRPGGDALLVLAASDLQLALPEVVRAFEAETGQRVQTVFGSTGNLTMQIEQGAPADLFLAANEQFIDRLEEAGLVDPGTRRGYATGRLALAWREGVGPPASLADLADPRFGAIALANPEHAPYGVAGREALQAAGVWDAVQPRLVLAENVAQAVQFVQSGNADAGVVALPVVIALPGSLHAEIDPALHRPLRQVGAVLRDAVDPFAGERFLEFLVGPSGREILERYGFEAPE
jgi:molybdate transport system substrate-binding protein